MSLVPLATQADLEGRLGRDLTASELARVDDYLKDASAAVRRYTGQEITEDTSVARVRVRGGWARLPQRPVTAVSGVESVSGDTVAFEWNGGEEVYVGAFTAWDPASVVWPAAVPLKVDVTYTHGYADVPDDIVAVVAGIVLRSLGGSPAETGLQSESIGSYSYTVGAAAAAGGLGMLPFERNVLDAYRRPVGVIYMS